MGSNPVAVTETLQSHITGMEDLMNIKLGKIFHLNGKEGQGNPDPQGKSRKSMLPNAVKEIRINTRTKSSAMHPKQDILRTFFPI